MTFLLSDRSKVPDADSVVHASFQDSATTAVAIVARSSSHILVMRVSDSSMI